MVMNSIFITLILTLEIFPFRWEQQNSLEGLCDQINWPFYSNIDY